MSPRFSQELLTIVAAIRQGGGRALLVGGAVRDIISGSTVKDLDIEVYGLQAPKLTSVLAKYGSVDQVGISFGVIKLRSKSGQEYDFSLPRRENKVGAGHRGFVVTPDAEMTPQEACSRRDFTINAMAFDFETAQILDFYGGQDDLRSKTLRHTSPAFAEDPLRVLRGFQFASRFGLTAAPETIALCAQLKAEYPSLAQERIWGEWYKWATKSTTPSSGIRFLKETGWLSLYPGLECLVDVPQNPVWHPEGSVYEHSCHVVDAAARIAKRDSLDEFSTGLLVLTGLCHDLGKPATTILEDGVWKAPGHPEAGEEPSKVFFAQIGALASIVEKAIPLISEHLSYLNVNTARNVRRLATRLGPATIQELMWVIEADHAGRPPLPMDLPEQARTMLEKAEETKTTQGKQPPILMGKHLIEASLVAPGPAMGKLLKSAYEAQMDGVFADVDGGLRFAQEYLKNQPAS